MSANEIGKKELSSLLYKVLAALDDPNSISGEEHQELCEDVSYTARLLDDRIPVNDNTK